MEIHNKIGVKRGGVIFLCNTAAEYFYTKENFMLVPFHIFKVSKN